MLRDRLPHTVTIERRTVVEGVQTERGDPTYAWSSFGPYPAWVQHSRRRAADRFEQRDDSGAGPVTTSHTILLADDVAREADVIRHDDRVFEVDGVRNAGGRGRHWEVTAHLVTVEGAQA